MAYFNDIGDKLLYLKEYCENCGHYDNKGFDRGCPVLDVHAVYAMDRFYIAQLNTLLDRLIPRNARHENERCAMFAPKGDSL
ncbi:MAG TPA: hypothetical protein PLV37_07725 [Bacillota bacterium]|nr:hypothetical protein [Bacillota bacterium]